MGFTWYTQLYTDKCIPLDERVACMTFSFFLFRSACHMGSHMTSSEDLTIPNKMFCLFPVTLLPSGVLGMTSSEDLTISNKMFCLFPVTLLPSRALGQVGFNLFLTPFLGRWQGAGGRVIVFKQQLEMLESSSSSSNKQTKPTRKLLPHSSGHPY